MAVRCYYWNSRKTSKAKFFLYKVTGRYNGLQLRHGNPGDVFNKDLLEWIYQEKTKNISSEGKRLLTIGSVMAQVKRHDVIAGIGWKGNNSPIDFSALSDCTIVGLRGPMTLEFLKSKSISVSDVEFLLDPGLLINSVYQLNIDHDPIKDRVIFIPHYREYHQYHIKSMPLNIELVSIDKEPKMLAREILSSELIYTSSLHVVIFAHALNRPCVLVKPQTEEPLFKYKDYFASIDLPFVKPLASINDASFHNAPISPIHVNKSLTDFTFPKREFLKEKGILE